MQLYALVVNTVPWQITDFKRWTKRPNLRGNWGSFISPSHVMTASVSSPPLSVAMSRSPPLHTYYTPWVTQNKTTVIYFTVRLREVGVIYLHSEQRLRQKESPKNSKEYRITTGFPWRSPPPEFTRRGDLRVTWLIHLPFQQYTRIPPDRVALDGLCLWSKAITGTHLKLITAAMKHQLLWTLSKQGGSPDNLCPESVDRPPSH